MRVLFLFLFLVFQFSALGQDAISTIQTSKSEPFDLFQKGQYEAVVNALAKKGQLSTSESYLLEMSSLKLSSTNPEQLQNLVKANTKHPLNPTASYVLGQHYFHNSETVEAWKYLKAVDPSQLSEADRADYYFMRGYVSLQNKQYKAAAGYFARSAKLTSNPDDKLTYYQGFSAYHLNQKEKALTSFEKVMSSQQFGVSANFFTAKMKLEEGRYTEVIALAQSELSEERTETNAAFYQLVGEAYALQNQADKSASYFNKAIELHPGVPSAALYYQAGVTNFKLGLKKKAIEYLTEAGIRSGDYAQLSAFQLARLYVSLDDKEKALAAYIEASESSDRSIKEEATFKAGKLQIDLGNHSEGINYLEDYLKTFKQGKWKTEAEQLLAEGYLRTSNYDQAIAHLQEIGVESNSQKSVYQKVTFQKAQLLFNDANFREAYRWLQESLKYPLDLEIGNKSWFLSGEIFFYQSQFENAIRAYKSQSETNAKSQYGIAYSYYNLNKYEDAASSFRRTLQLNPGKRLREDSEVRLADCYYATKSYTQALEIYSKYSARGSSAYLHYQTGLVSKNLGRNDQAVSAFEKVLKDNDKRLHDDAVFQMAQMSFESAQFDRSEFLFSKLVDEYPRSEFLAESYLNRAVSRTNLEKLEGARADYSFVLDNYITSKVAFNAILGLQELESKGVKVGNIQAEIDNYKKANPDDESLEVIEFDFAKSQYFNLEYNSAVNSFSKFIADYPRSSSLNEAKYYLADAHYRNDSLNDARKYFSEIRNIRNNLTGRVLSRLGETNFKLGNLNEANSAWEDLISLNITPKDTYNGRLGLMKSYLQSGDFEKSIQVADQIIAAEWQPLNATRNATLTKAKANNSLGNTEMALSDFAKVANDTDLVSAEASYSIAALRNIKGEYQASLDSLFSFNARFGSYSDWIDKSYLLIATNYTEMEELFQAKATLRSIIQHSQNQEAVDLAKEKLNAIENQSIGDTTTTSNN